MKLLAITLIAQLLLIEVSYTQSTFQYISCFPDLVWNGVVDPTERTLLVPGFADGSIVPTGLRMDNKVFISGPTAELLDLSQLTTDKYGYQQVPSSKKTVFVDSSVSDKYVVIIGKSWFYWDYYFQPDSKYYYIESSGYRRLSQMNEEQRKTANVKYDIGVVDDGIKSIRAWSELSETIRGVVTRYSAENMRNPFLLRTFDSFGVELNGATPPWAEGVPGPGIGGTIDVEFNRPTNEINILNGYVDLSKRHLYKENNRLKTIRIDSESPSFSSTHTFDDVVRFHEVPLPAETTKVRITILDVYKGMKYDDTCVTKLFIPQRQLRSRADYEAEIELMLKEVMEFFLEKKQMDTKEAVEYLKKQIDNLKKQRQW